MFDIFKKIFLCHPADPSHPIGPSRIKWNLKLTLRKIKYWDALLPIALTAKAIVTNAPLSVDVTQPIWGKALRATNRSGRCIVVIPVSSIFHMSAAVTFNIVKTLLKLSKNNLTS